MSIFDMDNGDEVSGARDAAEIATEMSQLRDKADRLKAEYDSKSTFFDKHRRTLEDMLASAETEIGKKAQRYELVKFLLPMVVDEDNREGIPVDYARVSSHAVRWADELIKAMEKK